MMKPSTHKTFYLQIIGKVQGVWFRASAKDLALSLSLTGKVWNEENGNVGIIIQGTSQNIKKFIEWSEHGPPLAKVEKVLQEEVIDEFHFDSFEITRY